MLALELQHQLLLSHLLLHLTCIEVLPLRVWLRGLLALLALLLIGLILLEGLRRLHWRCSVRTRGRLRLSSHLTCRTWLPWWNPGATVVARLRGCMLHSNMMSHILRRIRPLGLRSTARSLLLLLLERWLLLLLSLLLRLLRLLGGMLLCLLLRMLLLLRLLKLCLLVPLYLHLLKLHNLVRLETASGVKVGVGL